MDKRELCEMMNWHGRLHGAFGWHRTQQHLARALGIDTRTLRRYESGERPIPEPIANLLTLFAWLRDRNLLTDAREHLAAERERRAQIDIEEFTG